MASDTNLGYNKGLIIFGVDPLISFKEQFPNEALENAVIIRGFKKKFEAYDLEGLVNENTNLLIIDRLAPSIKIELFYQLIGFNFPNLKLIITSIVMPGQELLAIRSFNRRFHFDHLKNLSNETISNFLKNLEGK